METGKYSFVLWPGWIIILGLITAFLLTYVSIPTIIKVARGKGLYDKPNARSSHTENTPTLGGMAVFAGFSITAALFAGEQLGSELLYIITGLIILFFIGIKDDILIIDPAKKLLGQMVAASIVIILGDIRITDFQGFLGIHGISYLTSYVFTLFVFVVITNGFNLIDGIDGLAAGIGTLSSLVFGGWFIIAGHYAYAVISFSLAGSLLAFVRFNLSQGRNKIFLGDTGSLLLGMMLSVLPVRFLEYNLLAKGPALIHAAPVVAFTILIIPLFDTLQIVVLRIVKGRSLFEAGRRHIHHRLLRLSLSHLQATLILLFVNLFFVILVLLLQNIGDIRLLFLVLIFASVLAGIPWWVMKRRHPLPGEEGKKG